MLLQGLSTTSIIGINIFICAIWHFLVFVICITIKPSTFDYKRKCYQIKKWEKNGKWYDKKLKIKKWKDIIPQHIGKDGFSKRHMESLSIDYIELFILETCRGEWNHKLCLFYSLFSIIINPPLYGFIFGILTLTFNLACIAIQRYNRIRLTKVKNKTTREFQRKNKLQTDAGI